MTEGESKHEKLYVNLTLAIQAMLVLALIVFIWRRDWENVFLTFTVIGLTLIPAFMWRRYQIYLPPELQLVAVAFVYLSLFLGSARDYYYRFWWWDIVLHTGSGFLLGLVGFVAIYLLNHTNRLPQEVRPAFRCFFGVTFAVTLGVLWEIFEFVVDQIWPRVNMQSNETGVVDTMYDLIVDTLGAIVVAMMGWAYYRTGRYSFFADGIRAFIQKNPLLFGGKSQPPEGEEHGSTKSQAD
jgi:hypothetical protein